jgi:hypothetical protein
MERTPRSEPEGGEPISTGFLTRTVASKPRMGTFSIQTPIICYGTSPAEAEGDGRLVDPSALTVKATYHHLFVEQNESMDLLLVFLNQNPLVKRRKKRPRMRKEVFCRIFYFAPKNERQGTQGEVVELCF